MIKCIILHYDNTNNYKEPRKDLKINALLSLFFSISTHSV